MFKLIVGAASLLALTVTARADISSDLKFCAGLKSGKERLACYDAAARIEKRNDQKVVTRSKPTVRPSNATANSPAPTPQKSRFDGAYVGVTAGYDIPATALRDPVFPSYSVDVPADAISGAKIGLVGGYNVTIDRVLLGIEGAGSTTTA